MFDPKHITPSQRSWLRALSGCADKTIANYPRVADASKNRLERAWREMCRQVTGPPTIASGKTEARAGAPLQNATSK